MRGGGLRSLGLEEGILGDSSGKEVSKGGWGRALEAIESSEERSASLISRVEVP